MKQTSLIKLTLLLAILTISNVMSTNTVLNKVEEAQEHKCTDPCQECQRVVYQMKFQGSADCEVNGVCRNTCYKIKEAWGTAFTPYEPFLKDMFGKCEICFRNGHCTITQCHAQEKSELEVIQRVINSSRLTAKINPDLLVQFPTQADPQAVPRVVLVNQRVERVLRRDLNDAVKIGNAQHVIPKVQSLLKTYFTQPTQSVKGNAFTVLNGAVKPATKASGITYFNNQPNQAAKPIQNALNVVKKINNFVQELKIVRKAATKAQEKRQVQKIIKREQTELKRLVNKIDKKVGTFNAREKVLTKITNNSRAIDPNTKVALTNGISQINIIKNAINQAKAQFVQDRKQLKRRN